MGGRAIVPHWRDATHGTPSVEEIHVSVPKAPEDTTPKDVCEAEPRQFLGVYRICAAREAQGSAAHDRPAEPVQAAELDARVDTAAQPAVEPQAGTINVLEPATCSTAPRGAAGQVRPVIPKSAPLALSLSHSWGAPYSCETDRVRKALFGRHSPGTTVLVVTLQCDENLHTDDTASEGCVWVWVYVLRGVLH